MASGRTKKLDKCFELLEFLKTNGKTKNKDISNKLGISTRVIGYYRDTLVSLGYRIESHCGYYGGLEYIPPESLTDSELEIIEDKLGGKNSSLIEKIKRINKDRK